jgi:hypothetical protein
MVDLVKSGRWTITTLASTVGGGIAFAFAAAMDPSKYQFPRDFGSGILWKYFGMGAALTFGGTLLRSPLGQALMAGFPQSQKDDLADAKAALAAKAEK